MNKERIIQFRITEEQYKKLKLEADKEGIGINKLAARKTLSNNSTTALTPKVMLTLRGMYDLLEAGTETWTDTMADTYKKGLDIIYVFLKRS